jgi:hypothetical protein
MHEDTKTHIVWAGIAAYAEALAGRDSSALQELSFNRGLPAKISLKNFITSSLNYKITILVYY